MKGIQLLNGSIEFLPQGFQHSFDAGSSSRNINLLNLLGRGCSSEKVECLAYLKHKKLGNGFDVRLDRIQGYAFYFFPSFQCLGIVEGQVQLLLQHIRVLT